MSDLTEARGHITEVNFDDDKYYEMKIEFSSGDVVTLNTQKECCDIAGFSFLPDHPCENLVGKVLSTVRNDEPVLAEDREVYLRDVLRPRMTDENDYLKLHLLTLEVRNAPDDEDGDGDESDDENVTLFLLPYWDISNGYYDCYLTSTLDAASDNENNGENEEENEEENQNQNEENVGE